MSKVIAAIIFTAVIFTFFHSELGLFNFDSSNHSTHDYCKIVETAATKITKDVSKDIDKLKVVQGTPFGNKSIPTSLDQYTKSFSILDSEQFHTPQKTTEVYLFNSTFLI